jgi:hypothetical protein
MGEIRAVLTDRRRRQTRSDDARLRHQEMQVRVKVDPVPEGLDRDNDAGDQILAWHDGQKPRVLQENVNKCSAWQSGQRIRAKPERGFAQSR